MRSKILILLWLVAGCRFTNPDSKINVNQKSVGIILVNHGSRSATWRDALARVEKAVADTINTIPTVKVLKTAYMEYTEPSLATQLRSCDSLGVTDIIIVPVFLTVSSHSFDDIPTILGQKEDPQSIENLKIENIQRYTPVANTHITPLLDFSGIMKENVLRRVNSLSTDPAQEGLVLIGYGDATYEKEWKLLFDDIADHVKKNTGIAEYSYGWCGHIVHYNPDSTTTAIQRVLETKNKAVVIPVLLAHDEMFQVKIIGDGIQKIKNSHEKIIYKPDAILPDANLEKWVITITKEYVAKLNTPL